MSKRRPALQAALIALLLVLPHLLFLAVDVRPPNDHDTWYTNGVADSWSNAQIDDRPAAGLLAVAEHFLFEGWHPQLAQSALLVGMLAFGPSLLVFRGVNLLFFALLMGSTYSIGRQLRSHRFGLLVMALVAWMPGMLVYARKWEPMFHGAALSALAWALALRCLSPDATRLRWPWLALGIVLGARFYTHPTGLPDLGLTLLGTGFMALLLAGHRGESTSPVIRRVGMTVVLTFALGAWFLGLVPVVPDEPSYQLGHYLRWRAAYAGVGDAGGGLLGWQLEGVRKLVHALWNWHWHPVPALLLGVPGLTVLPWVLRRQPRSGATLLSALFLAQFPLVLLTFANAAVTPDWLHLTPLCVILAAFGMTEFSGRTGWPGRAAAAMVAGSLVYLTLGAWGPPLLSLAGPDPLSDDRAYTASVLQPFQQIDTGDREEAPHLLSRGEQAGDRVARLMAEVAAPGDLARAAVIEVQDLTLDHAADTPEAPWCGLADGTACCGFVSGSRGGMRDRFQPVWPFRFAGWNGVEVRDKPGLESRFVLVRLWHPDDVTGPLFEGQPHEPRESTSLRRCVTAARRDVESRFRGAKVVLIEDPSGRLISRMWAYPSEYGHRAYLVDRGDGVLSVPLSYQTPVGGPLPR